MFSAPEKLYFKLLSAFFLTFILFSANLSAQQKKVSAIREKSQTAIQKSSKDQSKNSVSIKEKTERAAQEKAAKSKIAANEKNQKSEKTKQTSLKKQAEEKRLADIRREEEKRRADEEAKRRAVEEAKRRAAEEARRQAALAEQRRREQLRREAEARRRAFELGLHTETARNIIEDETEGEDLEVRRAAVNALGKHAGMVVVLEAQTGKVLSIVNQDWAIRKSFKPCSTIKLVTAVAGINERVIKEDGNLRARRFPLNLDDALAFSNNTYFQAAGSNIGNEKMISYARMLGLGQPTGINAKDETSGKLPFGNRNARVYSHGDDFEVSPLQLAVMVSAISNGGKIIVPRIPRTKYEKTNFRGVMRSQINLSNDNLQGVVPGMIGAAQYGTARRGVDFSLGVAGKTGSCIGQGSWVGLFASVAPIENPQFSVVVITRGQSERGKYAAAIAGKIYQTLRPKIAENRNRNSAPVPLALKPESKVNAKTSASLDDGEGEDSEDNDALPAEQKLTVAPKQMPQAPVNSSKKTADLFPPIVIKVKRVSDEPTPQRDEMTRQRIVSNK
ncbi:MAG: penicillin-binding transpeptidase domain-containing protein [Pyrinomonadaceae bacterium]